MFHFIDADYRSRLVAFYKQYNPEKLSSVDQILAAYAVSLYCFVVRLREEKISFSVNWKPVTELLRSLPPLLLLPLPNTRVHVLILLVSRLVDFAYDLETAGQYFSQENPVIREITERVQRM